MHSPPPTPSEDRVVVPFPSERSADGVADDPTRDDPTGAWASTLSLTHHATERMRARRRLLSEAEVRLRDLRAALDDERRNSLQKISAVEQAAMRAEARVDATTAAIAMVEESIQGTIDGIRAAHEGIRDAAVRQQHAEAWLRRIQRALENGAHDRVAQELGERYDAGARADELRTHRAKGATASGAQ
jgi:hypothetical protein